LTSRKRGKVSRRESWGLHVSRIYFWKGIVSKLGGGTDSTSVDTGTSRTRAVNISPALEKDYTTLDKLVEKANLHPREERGLKKKLEKKKEKHGYI